MKQESTQFLHSNKALLAELIAKTSENTNFDESEIEKDYYITMILKLLSQAYDDVVFKGGTSLSKALKVLKRFSEDIDITFTERIGVGRRDILKNQVIKGISETLGLPITDFEFAQSKHDLNEYHFQYESVCGGENEFIVTGQVKMETALMSNSFPTKECMISCLIGDYLAKEARNDIVTKYRLEPFPMKVQTVERTYIDKIFALCDYYLEGSTKRLSRHLYDVYMLSGHVDKNEIKNLFPKVREQRSNMKRCPSAKESVRVWQTVKEFTDNDYYYQDYEKNAKGLIYGEQVDYADIKKYFIGLAVYIKEELEKN